MLNDTITNALDIIKDFTTLTPYQVCIIKKINYGYKLSKSEVEEIPILQLKYFTIVAIRRFVK